MQPPWGGRVKINKVIVTKKKRRERFTVAISKEIVHMPASMAQPPIPQDLLAKALATAANAIFITDETGCIVWVNDAFSRLSGYSWQEALGQTPALLKSGRQSEAFYADLWKIILSGNVWRGNLIDRRKDHTLYTVDEIITPLFDEKGNITHFIAIQNDITLRMQEDTHNHYLAYHDVLTGLPNRALFVAKQRQAMQYAKRTNHMLALLFLDLDNFKPVNDNFGHRIGDQLLIAVGERLRAAVRKADVVARWGGDEFAILLVDLLDTGIVTMLARKLLDTLARPFVFEGRKISVQTSIGIAIYPADGEEPETLLDLADRTMYVAKEQGGNRFLFYNPLLGTPRLTPGQSVHGDRSSQSSQGA